MNLVRRTRRSGSPLATLQTEMNDLFNSFLGDWGETAPWGGGWTPALDVSDQDDEVVVRAEVPGLKPEDIDISVQGSTLTISGEKKQETEHRDDTHYHSERRYGSFKRAISLPAEVDPDKIEASAHDGVLTITMGKAETAKPRRIEVKHE